MADYPLLVTWGFPRIFPWWFG